MFRTDAARAIVAIALLLATIVYAVAVMAPVQVCVREFVGGVMPIGDRCVR
jgi:hypothetical protein